MTKKKRGYFITFEGIDGCGKSTQVKLAADYLKAQGQKVVTFREPGSTKLAEKIRAILLDRRSDLTDISELLLYETARNDLVSREIKPALDSGRIVLCDRFYDSTTAYQGYGRKLDLKMVKSLHRVAVMDCHPDLTFLFDLDLKTARTRLSGQPDRLESQAQAFHQRVRKGFLEIARKEPTRVKQMNGRYNPEKVFEQVRAILDRRLKIK